MKKIISISCFLIISLLSNQGLFAQNKSIETIKQYYLNMDKGDIEACAQSLSNSFTNSNPFSPTPMDKEGNKMMGKGFKQAFPDMMHQIDIIFTDGKYVAVKGKFIGTNTGVMNGNPPTGKKVSLDFNTIFEIDSNGLIASQTVQFDTQTFNSQLMGNK